MDTKAQPEADVFIRNCIITAVVATEAATATLAAFAV
jgi:hypothetical protein